MKKKQKMKLIFFLTFPSICLGLIGYYITYILLSFDTETPSIGTDIIYDFKLSFMTYIHFMVEPVVYNPNVVTHQEVKDISDWVYTDTIQIPKDKERDRFLLHMLLFYSVELFVFSVWFYSFIEAPLPPPDTPQTFLVAFPEPPRS
jgi:hypothetical protein